MPPRSVSIAWSGAGTSWVRSATTSKAPAIAATAMIAIDQWGQPTERQTRDGGAIGIGLTASVRARPDDDRRVNAGAGRAVPAGVGRAVPGGVGRPGAGGGVAGRVDFSDGGAISGDVGIDDITATGGTGVDGRAGGSASCGAVLIISVEPVVRSP